MATANIPKVQLRLPNSSAARDPIVRNELNLIFIALRTIVSTLGHTQVNFTDETIEVILPDSNSQSEVAGYSGLGDSEAKN